MILQHIVIAYGPSIIYRERKGDLDELQEFGARGNEVSYAASFS